MRQFKPRQIGFKAHSKRFAVEFATRRMDLHRVEFGSKASAQASLFDLNGQVNAACDRCKFQRFPPNDANRPCLTGSAEPHLKPAAARQALRPANTAYRRVL